MSTNNNYETLDLHVGKALKMITDNYPTLTKVILELIQNSLDSDATNIVIAINYVSRNLSVSDNGSGITPAKFYHDTILNTTNFLE